MVACGDEKAHVVLFRVPLENFLEGEDVHRLTIVRKVTWEDNQFYFFSASSSKAASKAK